MRCCTHNGGLPSRPGTTQQFSAAEHDDDDPRCAHTRAAATAGPLILSPHPLHPLQRLFLPSPYMHIWEKTTSHHRQDDRMGENCSTRWLLAAAPGRGSSVSDRFATPPVICKAWEMNGTVGRSYRVWCRYDATAIRFSCLPRLKHSGRVKRNGPARIARAGA